VNKPFLIFLFITFLCGPLFVAAQENTIGALIVSDTVKKSKSGDINPLAPAKASFYSAIFPGMGQLYNKKYWKMPLVYAAIGTSVYFYVSNGDKYHEFRDVYKQRLAGVSNPEYDYLDNDRLIRAQQFYQRNRDLSVLVTAAFYVLNIIDANVDAHLMQFNVDDDLSFNPTINTNDFNSKPSIGFTINYKF